MISEKDFYHSTVWMELKLKKIVNSNFYTLKTDKMNVYKIILTNNEPIIKFKWINMNETKIDKNFLSDCSFYKNISWTEIDDKNF